MARPGYSVGVGGGVRSLVVTLASLAVGQVFASGSFKLRMPCSAQIVGITLNVGSRTGTHVTSTLDVLKTATSLLAAVFNIATLTPGTPVDKEGAALSAAAASVAKDETIVITTAEAGGTAPLWGVSTVQIDYVPLGN